MPLGVFEGFDYDPNTIECETFLSEVPLSLIEETITSQFDNPLDNRKNDLVQSFLNKYMFTKQNMLVDEEEEVDQLYTNFLTFMRDTFRDKLGIGMPNLEDLDEEDQMELVHFIYRFFIINIKKNFVNVILNYIDEHKNAICKNIELKKDVTAIALKKYVTDDMDLNIVSNIGDVIRYILDSEISVTEFLDYSSLNKPNLEAEYISDKYDTRDITGNFVENYCGMLNEDFLVEIECKVRNKILKKYRK